MPAFPPSPLPPPPDAAPSDGPPLDETASARFDAVEPSEEEELPRFHSTSLDDEPDSEEPTPYAYRPPSGEPELPRFPTASEEGLPRFPSSLDESAPGVTDPATQPLLGDLAQLGHYLPEPTGDYVPEPLEAPPSYEEALATDKNAAPSVLPLPSEPPPGRESLPDMIAEAAPLTSQPPAVGAEAEPRIGDVSLADVTGLQDLPPEAQLEFVRLARLERLTSEEEIGAFAVALVIEGNVALMPTIADVACGRAAVGDVVFTHGTLEEAIALRVVAGEEGALVAVWQKEDWERATADCPWVADELRLLADRFQALAGASMGALGDRFDETLRSAVTDRCQVKALTPGEILVETGSTIPGIHIVGGGRIELVDGEGDEASVVDELGPGDFLFPEQVLSAGKATHSARAASCGALVLFADRMTAHELLVSVPPLIELLAG